MFTDGLDSNALRWVKEGKGQDGSDSYKVPNLRPIIGPLSNIRSGEVGRGYGLLPTSKFSNGHLPVSRTIPVHGNVSASVSDDDDMCTDSEEEEDVYGGRYSHDSSPWDDRAPVKASVPRQQHYGKPRYATDSVYSDDVSSSMEIMGRRNLAERSKPGSSRHHPLRRSNNGYTDEDSDESNASSEFSSTQPVSKGPMAHVRSSYASDGYTSSVYSALAADKGPSTRNMHNEKMSDEDVPSAPPFVVSTAQTAKISEEFPSGIKPQPQMSTNGKMPHQAVRTASVVESGSDAHAGSVPARLPTFHASSQGPWLAVIAYDACVRLCLNAWAKQCMEAPMFLESECGLLRNAFGLQRVLLQSEEELMVKRSSVLTNEGAAPKPRKMVGKMKVQVRKVKMAMDPPTGCTFSSLSSKKLKFDSLRYKLSSIGLRLSSGWRAVRRIHFSPRVPPNGSFSRQTKAYVQASAKYVKQVSGLLKVGVTTLRNNSSSYEAVQENTYSCFLRLKSSSEEDVVRLHPGSGETHVFLPDSLGDDLIVEVHDSKGKIIGRALAQIAAVAEDPGDKLRWWSIFHEPEHELVGKLQLYVNYSTTMDENNLKCGSVAETVAYDLVLEVAMKVQQFQQRNLLLHGPWKWLLTEFSTYYGVSDAYTRLRYLSYIMDVATPTADCLTLVHDLLLPVIMKGNTKRTLSHQENRILGEVEDQINQILSMVFENYKSLDETAQSGMMDVFRPATGIPAPALEPAVKLFTLLHDILSPESQSKLYGYFQAAAKKRARRHLSETDEFVTSNINEALLMDPITVSTAYQKMKSLCFNIRNECFTDIEIHNQHVLPSFIDLPNLSSSIYSVELCNRLREFLIACPPSGPSPHVAELVIATADFQRDLCSWRINPVKGGVDAKELFHLYIMLWIQDKRLALLESCKLDKVKWSGVRTQHSTTPFVDDMYDRLKETLNDYEVIICRWPEYTFVLENAIADIEKATVEALEKQYADVLLPLKENLTPKKFGLKYVQKLTKRSSCPYIVPDELGILLNSLKRILDALRPKIEQQFKSWGSCIPDGGNAAPGERLSEVTVMLRTKFRNYIQAVVEKLVENTKLQNATKLKKILQDSKENVIESDIRNRIQPLKDQLTNTITHLQGILATQVFIFVCRGYWDRMGQEILTFLENRKENRSWYKGSTIAVSILDDTFGSQMQQLLGNSLHEKDLEPPKTIMEVRSMLCKDAASHKSNSYYF